MQSLLHSKARPQHWARFLVFLARVCWLQSLFRCVRVWKRIPQGKLPAFPGETGGSQHDYTLARAVIPLLWAPKPNAE